jgi:spore germination protein GerM
MKNKKMLFLLIGVLIITLLILFIIIKNFNFKESDENYSDYTPEEEISSEQYRETIVTLYYIDSETNTIKSEGRLIDSISLLQNPYEEIIKLLLSTPQTSNLAIPFPENTQLLDASIQNNCVTFNFSEELLNYTDDTQKYNIINCILNTITQLNEVNSFKILINNETSNEFNEEYSI